MVLGIHNGEVSDCHYRATAPCIFNANDTDLEHWNFECAIYPFEEITAWSPVEIPDAV